MMNLPSSETCQLLRNLKTEIGAGEILVTGSQADRAYNRAIEHACDIIDAYIEGRSLFQMTAAYAASTPARPYSRQGIANTREAL